MKKVPINRDRIKQVIYPTLGCPAIIKRGERLTLEFDPRNRGWDKALPKLTDFSVSVTTTNSAHPVTRELPAKEFTVGFSGHWPEYSQAEQPLSRIYLVTVEVPADLPVHLYDLMVTGTLKDASALTDSQPHALQVVNEFKTDYSFAHLTDIHVWGLEAQYPGSNTHERGWRHKEYSDADGYGATYYHKAIQQMNTAKPDFIVFTGDYDFGITWLYEQDYGEFDAYKDTQWGRKYYETWFELDWFYAETLKLDVPVFMLPGNHDGWVRYDQTSTHLEEDYLDSWRRLFGPRYFSFDYGPDSHFTGINSMDWTPHERSLHWAIPNLLLGPHKWQGQVAGGGDLFEAGWTKEREKAVDEEDFRGQLLWVKRDLEANASAKMKALLLHHDPWKTEGSGSMFEHMPVIPGLLPFGGRGTGRLALIKLARENNVALVLSGHDHTDAYGSVVWEDGRGEVRFANTTSTQFQDGERQNRWEYPGYRLVRVKAGVVDNCYYKLASDANGAPMHYSWPFYAGTRVGGPNDLESLTDPAIEATWSPRPGRAQNVSCTIANRLTGFEITPGRWSGDLEQAVVEFPMPVLSGGHYYTVTNGTIVEIFENEAGDRRTYVVTTDVSHASAEDEPSTKTVKMSKSSKLDTEAPTCTTFQIDGGAATTGEARVTLTNDAVDTGGSGLQDMKIWNDGDSEAEAKWRRDEASTGWELRHEAGARTVNIRFRDGAMPANESGVYSATITLEGSPPAISAVTPGAARAGERVSIEGGGFGAGRTGAGSVQFDGVSAEINSWSDTRITCSVPYGASTGEVSVFTDTGCESSEFHVMPSVTGVFPDHAYNGGVIHVDNVEGTGFFAGGKPPEVKLTDGPIDIPAINVEVVSPQNITCDFDLTGVTQGYYGLAVKNEDGYDGILEGGLVIDTPAPVVTGLTPDGGLNTGTVDVTDLAGGNFLEGMRAWLVMGRTEIEATAVAVTSPTSATCTLDITGARAGKWRVRVRNKDGKEGSLSRGFTVE